MAKAKAHGVQLSGAHGRRGLPVHVLSRTSNCLCLGDAAPLLAQADAHLPCRPTCVCLSAFTLLCRAVYYVASILVSAIPPCAFASCEHAPQPVCCVWRGTDTLKPVLLRWFLRMRSGVSALGSCLCLSCSSAPFTFFHLKVRAYQCCTASMRVPVCHLGFQGSDASFLLAVMHSLLQEKQVMHQGCTGST